MFTPVRFLRRPTTQPLGPSHRPSRRRLVLLAAVVLPLLALASPSAGGQLLGWFSQLPAATLRALPTSLTWRQLLTASGSPVIGSLHGATESFGDLMLLVDQGSLKEGLGLTRVPGLLPAAIPWQRVSQSGITPQTFAASVGGGTIVAVAEEGSERLGRDLAFVPVAALAPLTWQALPFSGLPAGTRVSQARISNGGTTIGSLVLIDHEGSGKKGLALAFVPGASLPNLSFAIQTANLFGTTFRRAIVPTGTLFSSATEGVGRSAAGLDFFAGPAPGSLNFQAVQSLGSITNVSVFQAPLATGRLVFAFREGNQRRGEDLAVVP
jgi:hypothetical protein